MTDHNHGEASPTDQPHEATADQPLEETRDNSDHFSDTDSTRESYESHDSYSGQDSFSDSFSSIGGNALFIP
jgi:hypothetical protein